MDFKDTIQGILERGVEISKKTYDKAKELGEMGIQQIEIKTLEHKMAKKTGELGTIAYTHFKKADTALNKNSKGIPEIIKEISSLQDKIKKLEKELKNSK